MKTYNTIHGILGDNDSLQVINIKLIDHCVGNVAIVIRLFSLLFSRAFI